MKILIVGGTGMIGGHAALYLQQQGHGVSVMARSAPTAAGVAELPFIAGDYALINAGDPRLKGFDAMVFAAGGDIRHVPRDGSMSAEDFYDSYNTKAIPRFFQAAREAGISRTVYIGTFYPRVAPEQVKTNAYVRSRKLADERVLAMSGPGFEVISLQAPFVLGHLPGLHVPYLEYLCKYAKGEMGAPLFAQAGGTNHITVTSLSEAILGALEHGEPGRGYLVGDENLSWKDYLEEWMRQVGKPQALQIRDEEHPIFPDLILFAGRNATISYEPEGVEELGYSRGRVKEAIAQIVANY